MTLTGYILRSGSVALLLVVSVVSRPIPVLDLDQLAKQAHVIAVGQVSSVREVGKTVVEIDANRVLARIMLGEMRVDHMLKGPQGLESLTFRFPLPEMPLGFGSVQPLTYRLFFFKSSENNYEFASPYYPSVVAVPGVPLRGETVLVRVVNQVGAVLYSPTSSDAQKREAINVLRGTKNPAAIDALRHALEEKDVTVHLDAAAALLQRNDIAGLPMAENALMNPQPGAPSYILHNLTYAVSEGVKDEKAVPSLVRLLSAAKPAVRRAAASALRHTGSRLAIDPLLSVLGDSDVEVRYYAVVGLAEITGQTEWRPNMDDFLSDESRYLKHWRDWARNR